MKNTNAEKILIETIRLLREERERQKLSVKRLAALSGVSRTGLTHIEKEQRSPSLLNCLRIAEALEVRLGDIVNEAAQNVNDGQ